MLNGRTEAVQAPQYSTGRHGWLFECPWVLLGSNPTPVPIGMDVWMYGCMSTSGRVQERGLHEAKEKSVRRCRRLRIIQSLASPWPLAVLQQPVRRVDPGSFAPFAPFAPHADKDPSSPVCLNLKSPPPSSPACQLPLLHTASRSGIHTYMSCAAPMTLA